MCKLMVYHPETKSWQSADGKTLESDQFYAVFHQGHQNFERSDLIDSHVEKPWIPCGIPYIGTEPSCKECLRILQSFCHNEDTENQRKDS
ncbi:hypothetical protein ES703_88663 [subsurface metagenome]